MFTKFKRKLTNLRAYDQENEKISTTLSKSKTNISGNQINIVPRIDGSTSFRIEITSNLEEYDKQFRLPGRRLEPRSCGEMRVLARAAIVVVFFFFN